MPRQKRKPNNHPDEDSFSKGCSRIEHILFRLALLILLVIELSRFVLSEAAPVFGSHQEPTHTRQPP